jgi:hypothetical protein
MVYGLNICLGLPRKQLDKSNILFLSSSAFFGGSAGSMFLGTWHAQEESLEVSKGNELPYSKLP